MWAKPNNENNQKQPKRPKGWIAYLTERPLLLALWYVWPPLLLTLNLGRIFKLGDHQLLVNVVYEIITLTVCGLGLFTKIKSVSWWDWSHLMVVSYGSGLLIGGNWYLAQGHFILVPALLALVLYFAAALKLCYDHYRLSKKIRLLKRKLREQRLCKDKLNQSTHKK